MEKLGLVIDANRASLRVAQSSPNRSSRVRSPKRPIVRTSWCEKPKSHNSKPSENWPAIVEAAFKASNDIDRLVVLIGATGMNEFLGQVMGQGASGLQIARSLLAAAAPKDEAKSQSEP